MGAQKPVIKFIAAVEKNFPVIHLEDVMCEKETCYASHNDVPLYIDYGHLTPQGSAYIGTKINLYQQIVIKISSVFFASDR